VAVGTVAIAPAGLVALMIAECNPSPTWWVKDTETSVNPAAVRPASYSALDRAPAMQPTQAPRSARSSVLRWSSVTTSVMPRRPPGLRTR
jgi:hypothetical protein